MEKRGLEGRKPAFIAVFVLMWAVIITGCSDDFLTRLGSGNESLNLDKEFEWYRTQMNTGPAAGNNCGPASVSMALMFSQGRDVAIEDVRNTQFQNGGWWYMHDVKNALETYMISYRPMPLLYKGQLFSSLSRGHIVIVCLNMERLTREDVNAESRVDRFYDNITGHFIILKGFSDDKEWFYAYDSNTWANDYYTDGSPKGKDRRYRADEVVAAVRAWNPQFLEI